MENNKASVPNYSEGNNMIGQNQMNINPKESNIPQNIDKNANEKEENDNLGYSKGMNNINFVNFNTKQRLDSTDSPIQAQFKFSIDMPNVPKQRLHEFLNEDLLNAIEQSPNIPNLNSELPNNKNNNTNVDNNPNNLFGFSLYPQNPPNIENNNNNINNINFIQEPDIYPGKNWSQINNQNNINNNNFTNIYNNNINFNNYNYNYNINFPETTNISNNLINTLNNNPPVFIPKQMRNKNYNQKDNNLIMDEKNIKFFNNGNKINTKNKFDNNKKNSQNSKKEGKMKKPFEVRIGDWTCSKCNNLNFSFRNKCNRCGIPKEESEKYQGELMNQEMINQNINFNFPNDGRF
jgi:hypothetical protein